MGLNPKARILGSHVALMLGVIAIAALVLFMMGREPICKCGYVKLWHGVVASVENSQHLADWYSPSHIVHGVIFYGALWLLMQRAALGLWLVLATMVEGAWEAIENTDAVINRYREATISLDYYGDSVINSAFDILFMVAGLLLAARLSVWLTIVIVIALELFVGAMIRDNLTLNVIMLLWPLEAIRHWQAGG